MILDNLTKKIASLETGTVAAAYSAARYGREVDVKAGKELFSFVWSYQALQWTYEWISQKGFDILLGTSLVYIEKSSASPLVLPLGNIRIPTMISIGSGGLTTATLLEKKYITLKDSIGNASVLGPIRMLPVSADETAKLEGQLASPYPYCSAVSFVDRTDDKNAYTNINWKEFGDLKINEIDVSYVWGGEFEPCQSVKIAGSNVVISQGPSAPSENIVVKLDGFVSLRPCIALEKKKKIPGNSDIDFIALDPFASFTHYNLLLGRSALVSQGLLLQFLTSDDTRYASEVPRAEMMLGILREAPPQDLYRPAGRT